MFFVLLVTLLFDKYARGPISRSKLLVASERRYCIDGFSLLKASHLSMEINGTRVSGDSYAVGMLITCNASLEGLCPRFALIASTGLRPGVANVASFSSLRGPGRCVIVSKGERIHGACAMCVSIRPLG